MTIRLTIHGFEPNLELERYVHAKLERLERYIPRRERQSAAVEVVLRERGTKLLQRTCQLTVKVAETEFTVSEVTQHMYASIDVAAADIIRQLQLHKRQASGRTRLFRRDGRGPGDKA